MNNNRFLQLSGFALFLGLWLFTACSDQTKQNTANSSTANEEKAKSTATTTSTKTTALPVQRIQELVGMCNKAEYTMYNVGVTFETDGPQALSFFNYISPQIANETNCKKGNHDGGVVFKDPEGDIRMSIEFNVLNNCNRAVFKVDDKKYSQAINEAGLQFFGQILNMKPQ